MYLLGKNQGFCLLKPTYLFSGYIQGVPKKFKIDFFRFGKSGHFLANLGTFGRSGHFLTFLGTLGTVGHSWALWALLGTRVAKPQNILS